VEEGGFFSSRETPMPLNIKNPEAHEYAKELAAISGKSITEVVIEALKGALKRARYRDSEAIGQLTAELDDIAVYCASLPILDSRTPDEILGYNDIGVSE
jgi:antitoxin VapB